MLTCSIFMSSIKNNQQNIIKIIQKDYIKSSRKISKLSKEAKRKKQQYGNEQYKNLEQDAKQKWFD